MKNYVEGEEGFFNPPFNDVRYSFARNYDVEGLSVGLDFAALGHIQNGSPDYTFLVPFSWAKWSPSPVPIPAAAWLFGTALIGLFGFSKRRKAA